MVIIVEFAMMLMLLKAIMTIIMAMMTIRVTMMQMTAMIVFRVHGNDDSRTWFCWYCWHYTAASVRAHQVKIAYIHVRFLVQTLVSMSMSKPALCRTISILMAQALHFNLQLHTRENPSLPADIFPRAERLTRTLFSKKSVGASLTHGDRDAFCGCVCVCVSLITFGTCRDYAEGLYFLFCL